MRLYWKVGQRQAFGFDLLWRYEDAGKIPEVVRHASTVVLAHTDEKSVQRYVADLFGQCVC